jgi:hypothetical protein
MGIPPLSDSDLGITPVSGEFVGNAPLWFYVLKEAEKKRDGKRLGPVGARIVAEVLLGLLAGDPQSFPTVQPAWHPVAPFAKQGKFRMQELISFALS